MTELKQEKEIEELKSTNNSDKSDFVLDIATSSAISRVNIKFLAVYIPIFWLSGFLVAIYLYEYIKDIYYCSVEILIFKILFLPFALLSMYFIFILSSVFFCKLFLVLINLIHEPKEGTFRAEAGDPDFDFWCLRIELKKLALWIIRNCPLPWLDVLAFRWFGIKMDFSSHLQDSWTDAEFIEFGHKVMVGQGAVIMSSMVVGNYLIIKKIIFSDYALIGGQSTIAPGTIFGEDTVLGAVSITTFNQFLEPGWVYFGIPARKMKPNKYSETRRDIIYRVDVDKEKKYDEIHEINIDKDLTYLIESDQISKFKGKKKRG